MSSSVCAAAGGAAACFLPSYGMSPAGRGGRVGSSCGSRLWGETGDKCGEVGLGLREGAAECVTVVRDWQEKGADDAGLHHLQQPGACMVLWCGEWGQVERHSTVPRGFGDV